MRSRSGAYRLTLPLKNAWRRLSAKETPFSGRNHFSVTLASMTSFRIGVLSLHESTRSYPKAAPPASESARGDGGSSQVKPCSDQEHRPSPVFRLLVASLLCPRNGLLHTHRATLNSHCN